MNISRRPDDHPRRHRSHPPDARRDRSKHGWPTGRAAPPPGRPDLRGRGARAWVLFLKVFHVSHFIGKNPVDVWRYLVTSREAGATAPPSCTNP